jgi:hypothetical protein
MSVAMHGGEVAIVGAAETFPPARRPGLLGRHAVERIGGVGPGLRPEATGGPRSASRHRAAREALPRVLPSVL